MGTSSGVAQATKLREASRASWYAEKRLQPGKQVTAQELSQRQFQPIWQEWPETPATTTFHPQIPSSDDLGEEPPISRLFISILASIIFLLFYVIKVFVFIPLLTFMWFYLHIFL